MWHWNILIYRTLFYVTLEYIDISDTVIRDTGIYYYIGDYDIGHRNMLIFRTLWYGAPEYVDISDTMIWGTGLCWYFWHLLRIISKPILPQLNFTGLNDVTTKTIFYLESIFFQYVKMETQLKLKHVNMWNKLLTVYITHYIYFEFNLQIDFNNTCIITIELLVIYKITKINILFLFLKFHFVLCRCTFYTDKLELPLTEGKTLQILSETQIIKKNNVRRSLIKSSRFE